VGQDGILRADWQSALGVHSSPNPSRKRQRPGLAFYSLPLAMFFKKVFRPPYFQNNAMVSEKPD
jgi:hypothetical protein